jgi:hypothetical protein
MLPEVKMGNITKIKNMKQEQIYTTTQIEQLLNDEFKKFEKQWHGVMQMSDLQTLAKFIEQVKEKVNQTVVNKC